MGGGGRSVWMAVRGDAGIQWRERRIHTVREGHLPQSQEAGRWLGHLGLWHVTEPEGTSQTKKPWAGRSVLGILSQQMKGDQS